MAWRTWVVVFVVAIIATVWWQRRDAPVVMVARTASPAIAASTAGDTPPAQAGDAPSRGVDSTGTVPPASPSAGPAPAPVNPQVAAPGTNAPPPAQGIENPRLLLPVQGIAAGEVTDTFTDARSNDRVHDAIDILAPAGTPVLAVADGTVEKLFDSKLGGLTIYQFEPSGRYAYYYAHLQSYAPGLVEKQPVTRGQVIGYVGSTGNADPAAPHLHFAVFELGPERQWWRGTAVNPYPLLGGGK